MTENIKGILNIIFCSIIVVLFNPVFSKDRDSIHLDNCDPVNTYLANTNIIVTQPVSNLPFHDGTAQICYDGKKHTHHKSCCSRAAESTYNATAKQHFLLLLKQQNLQLKQVLQEKLQYFQDKFLYRVQAAENRTDIILRSSHSMSISERRPVTEKFFKNLRTFLLTGRIDIKKSVDIFFTELYPYVFNQKDIGDLSLHPLTEEYKDCLIQSIPQISPQPFGALLYALKSELTYTFSIAHSFLESIKLVIYALTTTENLNVSDSCLKALTKLHFCSKCQGHLKAKPCLGLCQNIMRGCLSPVLEFGPEWDDLVSTVKALSLKLTDERNLRSFTTVLEEFEGRVSDALMQAMVVQHTYYKQITKKLCGEPRRNNETIKRMTEDVAIQPPTMPSLHKEIVEFVDGVVSYHGWPLKIASRVCNDSETYDQSMKSETCWNGKQISLYNEQIPNPNFISQVKYNPEVKVIRVDNKQLVDLQRKLHIFRKTMNRRLNGDLNINVQSDQALSGDGYNDYAYRKYVVKSDDAYTDEETSSGSGSGEGSGKDEEDDDEDGDRSKDKGGKKSGTDKGGYEHITVKPDIDFAESNSRSSNNNNGNKGTAASTLHTHPLLFLFTLWPVLHILFSRR